MNYDFDKWIKTILNKQFKESIRGYDPEDVDRFFDDVNVYIDKVRTLQLTLSKQLQEKDKIIEKVRQENDALNFKIEELKKKIDLYKSEGYSNNIDDDN